MPYLLPKQREVPAVKARRFSEAGSLTNVFDTTLIRTRSPIYVREHKFARTERKLQKCRALVPPERADSLGEAAVHRHRRQGACLTGPAEKQQNAGSGKQQEGRADVDKGWAHCRHLNRRLSSYPEHNHIISKHKRKRRVGND